MVNFSLSERQQVVRKAVREFADARRVADGASEPQRSVVVEGAP